VDFATRLALVFAALVRLAAFFTAFLATVRRALAARAVFAGDAAAFFAALAFVFLAATGDFDAERAAFLAARDFAPAFTALAPTLFFAGLLRAISTSRHSALCAAPLCAQTTPQVSAKIQTVPARPAWARLAPSRSTPPYAQ
jgi:hypothetical protein